MILVEAVQMVKSARGDRNSSELISGVRNLFFVANESLRMEVAA